MVSIDPSLQRVRARRAYELGRWRRGLRVTPAVLGMIILSLLAGGSTLLAAGAGLTLLGFSVAFRWRGQVWGRAVVPGLLAGSAPLVLPPLLRSAGYCCVGNTCWSFCLLGCTLGGLLAGVAIGVASAAEKEGRAQFLCAATMLAGLAGILGCAIVGAAGITGMVLAVILSSLPTAAVARLRWAR
jgi:hypothetical protein